MLQTANQNISSAPLLIGMEYLLRYLNVRQNPDSKPKKINDDAGYILLKQEAKISKKALEGLIANGGIDIRALKSIQADLMNIIIIMSHLLSKSRDRYAEKFHPPLQKILSEFKLLNDQLCDKIFELTKKNLTRERIKELQDKYREIDLDIESESDTYGKPIKLS